MRPTNRKSWMVLLAFLGTAMVANPGCSNEVENSARNGLDPALMGLCTPAADDGDPCTVEGCQGSTTEHIVVAGLPCGVGGALKCTPTGACGGCSTPDQCGDSLPCLPWVCDIDQICRQTPSPNGQALQTQIPKDCKKVVCDGQGGEKTVNDDTDVPKYDCYMTTCSGGSEVKMPSPQGTSCTSGGNSCDGEGNCVECNTDADCGSTGNFCDPKSNTCFKCNDGIKNGDESDIDCGGIRCARCMQGQGCSIPGDCTTNFCADGLCCNTACDQPCEACDLAGSIGTCDYVAKYSDDPSYGNGMTCLAANKLTCNGFGACKGALGQPCNGPTECASTKCSNSAPKVCVKNTGDTCTQGSECFSGSCMNGMCT